jgi:hypothetical protein
MRGAGAMRKDEMREYAMSKAEMGKSRFMKIASMII